MRFVCSHSSHLILSEPNLGEANCEYERENACWRRNRIEEDNFGSNRCPYMSVGGSVYECHM